MKEKVLMLLACLWLGMDAEHHEGGAHNQAAYRKPYGIPLGIQAFKMAGLTLTPFGATVQYGGGVGSALANILWVMLVGWWMALGYLGAGMLNCITIIGIPFGLQSFKMAKLALWPFGAEIVNL